MKSYNEVGKTSAHAMSQQ